MNNADPTLEELNKWMLAHHMHGYWMQEGGGSGAQGKPYLWKWADIHAGLARAGELVPIGPARMTETRTIVLHNPEARGVPRAISLSPQILMPGERTRPNRDLMNETRFVVQAPSGATFVTEGEAFPMEPGDLVVSPAGTDYDHHNDGGEPAIWLDSQDMGLLRFVGAEKASWISSVSRRPPARYPWTETYATLMALKESEAAGDPYDGIHLRYTSPTDGGPTLPTLSCEIQLLTSGAEAGAHRHNSTAIYHVVRGEGRTEVAGEWLNWTQGDIFCVPAWTWHRHETPPGEDAILYSVDDWPAMTKMGFYRKE